MEYTLSKEGPFGRDIKWAVAAAEKVIEETPIVRFVGAEVSQANEVLANPEAKIEAAKNIFDFSSRISEAYKEIRYKDTPAMEEANENGETESIAEHMWDVEVTWRNLELVYPNLAATMDGYKIARMLSIHDMGEIVTGDISRDAQLNGEGKDKGRKERDGIVDLVSKMPEVVGREYLTLYDEYEEAKTMESKMANIVDSICGTTHYFDKADISKIDFERQRKMNDKKLKPCASDLLIELEARGEQAAYEDLMAILEGFCEYVSEKGMPMSVMELVDRG